MWFLTCVPNFSFRAWLEVPQEPPHPQSHTCRTFMVPDWRLGGWGHPWHHGSLWYVVFDLCIKFQLSSMIRCASRTTILEVILGGHWMFLTGDYEDGVMLDVLDHLEIHRGIYPESFEKIGGQRPVPALCNIACLLNGISAIFFGTFDDPRPRRLFSSSLMSSSSCQGSWIFLFLFDFWMSRLSSTKSSIMSPSGALVSFSSWCVLSSFCSPS